MSEVECCAACGYEHADPKTAVRVGIAFIAAECAWTLRYPGHSANEVIDMLEARIAGYAEGGVTSKAVESWTAPPGPEPSPARNGDPDPALTGLTEKLCPVCEGDGELVDPAVPDTVVVCARCDGSGRVKVMA